MTDEKPQGFDLRVTYRDEKTGLVTHTDPYILRVIAAPDGGRTRLFERPSGSGNLWNKRGEPVGRWIVDPKTKQGTFKEGEPHVAWQRPETDDERLVRSVIERDAKIAELERELAAIQGEKQTTQQKSKGA